MLDEQDATNRDAKGLPFTVRSSLKQVLAANLINQTIIGPYGIYN